MKNIICSLITLIICAVSFSQNEASFWYFGKNSGLQFNTSSNTVTAITDGQIDTLEGCTTISDTNGNLLFYSDGSTVWNRNHQVMQNGTGLKGDDSSTSSGLIVPKPQDPNFYYLFTVDEPHHFNSAAFPNESTNDGVNDGLTYSRININDNGGLGAVEPTEKNIALTTYDPGNPLHVDYKCSEKITAVKADDCDSFWVITHFTDTFYAFKIDENGVNTTPTTSTVGPNIPVEGYRRNALGYLKASPDGTKLISANFGESTVTAQDAGGGIYLFDFDNDTGVVSNSLELYSAQNNNSPYGVEFSAENKKVYATVGLGTSGNGASRVFQWDLESVDIPNSIQQIHASNTLSAGALQLGLDKKIYRAQVNFNNFNATGRYLGVINNPEADGTAANYNEQGVLLDINGGNQNLSRIGLPPFIQSLFNSQVDIIRNGISTTELKLCNGEDFTLQGEIIAGADYTWFKDGLELTTEITDQLFVDTPGFYEVFIEPNNGDCPIEGSALVTIFDIPVANPLTNISVCDDDNDGQVELSFTNTTAQALLTQDPTLYSVSYFETLEDATNAENEIITPYINTSNSQTLFVRVFNIENPNCFDVNSFELTMFRTPQISTNTTLEFCDETGDFLDGITDLNLQDVIPNLIGNQTQINVSFHPTQTDADNNTAQLPVNYTNTTAFSTTIFIRVENANNTNCVNTSSLELIINPLPVANDVSLIQCDEDGIPEGFTVFNILQIEDNITNNQPNVTVSYYKTLLEAETNTNPINASAFNNFANPELVYAKVTNTITGCVNYAEISLEVSTTFANNASIQACDDDGTEDGFTSFNLNAADGIVIAGAPVGLIVNYYETYEDALLETNPLSENYINVVPYNQTIFARIENQNACFGISEIELSVNKLPNLEPDYETIYCLNDFPETLVLDGGLLGDNPSNYFYEWSTGETSYEIEVNTPGTFTVRVTTTNGCFKERRITIIPSNIATVTDVEITDVSQNNSITVFVTGEGNYEFALNNQNGPYQDSNTFEGLTPGFYEVYIKDKNDCGIVSEKISVIGFPKFFTPNTDEKHDFWQVYGVSDQFQPNTLILIYDRYGKLLKKLDPKSRGWDGTYNGVNMPTNDYWFTVTLDDGRVFSGHFTLKR